MSNIMERHFQPAQCKTKAFTQVAYWWSHKRNNGFNNYGEFSD